MNRLLTVCAALFLWLPLPSAFAQGSAWLPDPQTGYASLSYVHQTADKYYRAGAKRPTPADGEDLSQNTLWLNMNYAVADSWALDMRAGWAKSNFTTGPGIPASQDSFDGLIDMNLGVTWRIVDEARGDLPSIALRGGVIIAGDYETGNINSLGDGGDGYEISAIVGRFLNDRFSLSAEVGYRDRNEGIPSNLFVNVSSLFLVTQNLALGLEYAVVDAESGLDIGGPGFSPPRFPELEEDSEIATARIFYNFGNFGVNLFYGAVVDGRNTPDSNVVGATVSYLFDTF